MIAGLFSIVIFFSFLSCSDSGEDTPGTGSTVLELSDTRLTFDRIASTKVVTVTTNARDVTARVSPEGWCTAVYTDGKLNITTQNNPDSDSRATIITITADDLKKSVSIMQNGRSAAVAEIKDDIKIPVKNGQASSSHSGEGIEKSFDGDMSTIYHSDWNNSAANYFPITLTYNFENVSTMDYLVYNPRTSGGSNGIFKEFELWVATDGKPLAKYGDYDFQGSPSASRITFSPALVKPAQIQFVIKSGAGDGQGFASCAEMQFFKKNPDNFDYLAVFTDHTCSQLKSSVTKSQIEAIDNAFFRELALEIFNGEYDPEFRVQAYRAWQHPDIMAKTNKTSTYGLRDNPTGIYSGPSEDIIVFAGDTYGQNPALLIQDPNNKLSGSTYPLSTGMNKIKAANTGLMYIMYYTKTGEEKPIKVNIVTGTVNGYFDSRKHKKDDWSRLLAKATFRHFDVLGKYASMTFETSAFREYTPDGLALINKYDDLVSLEQEFMGLYEYDREYKNRAYFLVIYDSFMYATGYYTAYNTGTQADILNLQSFSANACWGPAHELGHIHQTRPGLKWLGMAEVTNNIHSLYVQTTWGNQSRLIYDGFYKEAFSSLLKKGIPHNAYPGSGGSHHFVKLVPFWQLKLYMIDILGKTNFYKDIYEALRNQEDVDTSVITEGYYQLNFVKLACESAQLDLTEFFEAWGFLTPIDIEMDDYGKDKFIITQAQINEVKAEIAAKNYPKPKHSNIYDIRDDNLNNFK
ncbi:MAG: M60 family metallopeptidase [Prevotella sp.]|nr:M60 family metallopeptidase [Prevotella sp.]